MMLIHDSIAAMFGDDWSEPPLFCRPISLRRARLLLSYDRQRMEETFGAHRR